jgi:SpoVK/Ycf46/Vps4 family AAA+-type ATPase
MSATLSIRLYDPTQEPSFPPNALDAWVTEATHRQLVGDARSPIVKIHPSDPLFSFQLWVRLQKLNSKQPHPDSEVYLDRVYRQSSFRVEDRTKVHIEPISLGDLPEAAAITVKLPDDKVRNWSAVETEFAANAILAQNEVAAPDHPIWVKPATAEAVLGTVVSVRGRATKAAPGPHRLTEDTEVFFTGLPDDQQKIIDFSKIGGLADIITRLREIIQIPLQHPDLFRRFRITPPKGLLLHGPPGNGKTMIARAVSHSLGARFFAIEGPECLSKYVGQSEQFLRNVFSDAEKAGQSVIFIDEIDAIARIRDHAAAGHEISVVATLLNLMDGMSSKSRIFVIAATNRLHSVDPALRRPGRFDLELEVPIPSFEARKDILSKYVNLHDSPLFVPNLPENYLDILADLTNGFSGADLVSLYRESAMSALRRAMRFDPNGKVTLATPAEEIRIQASDFEDALRHLTPTSRRGHDRSLPAPPWANLQAVEEQKTRFEEIHAFLSSPQFLQEVSRRSELLNLIVHGSAGTGKSTLIRSFCTHHRLEILTVWTPDLLAKGSDDGFRAIETQYGRAQQLAPAVVVFEQCELLRHDARGKLIIAKIHHEEGKLSPQHRIISVIEWNSDDEPPEFVRRKRFAATLRFARRDCVHR